MSIWVLLLWIHGSWQSPGWYQTKADCQVAAAKIHESDLVICTKFTQTVE